MNKYWQELGNGDVVGRGIDNVDDASNTEVLAGAVEIGNEDAIDVVFKVDVLFKVDETEEREELNGEVLSFILPLEELNELND